jgi:signal transduction protein with GAF and PtsI domain
MKKVTLALSALLLAGSLAFTACKSDNKKESRTEEAIERTGDAAKADAEDVATDVRQKSDQAGDDFRKERDKTVADMKAEQTKIDARLEELRADMKRQGKKIKAETRQETAKLEARRNQIGEDMKRAGNATADAWQEIKKGFKRAGDKLDNK